MSEMNITVSLKIDENSCKQKYKLIQVMGALYRNISYIALPAIIYLPVSMKNGLVLLSCIF